MQKKSGLLFSPIDIDDELTAMTFELKDDKATSYDQPTVLEPLDGFTPTLPDHALRLPAQSAIVSAPVRQQSLAELANRLAALCSGQSAAERLRSLRKEVVGRIVFTTSFGLED